MNSVIEPLYKTTNYIDFGWNQQGGATSYSIYVALAPDPAAMTIPLYAGIPTIPSNRSQDMKKVPFRVQIADVQTFLSLPYGSDFSNTVFYFALTYFVGGTESTITSANVIEVPPVGVLPRTMRDDPTINRHLYVFNNDIQRWTKAAGSSTGALVVDTADFYKSNVTMEYAYDGTNLSTIKTYPSDATTLGFPAKLTTYTYTGGLVTKIQITDSTI